MYYNEWDSLSLLHNIQIKFQPQVNSRLSISHFSFKNNDLKEHIIFLLSLLFTISDFQNVNFITLVCYSSKHNDGCETQEWPLLIAQSSALTIWIESYASSVGKKKYCFRKSSMEDASFFYTSVSISLCIITKYQWLLNKRRDMWHYGYTCPYTHLAVTDPKVSLLRQTYLWSAVSNNV